MGLIAESAGVFAFLRDLFDVLPVAVKQLAFACFGGTIYIAVMRGIWR